MMLVTVPLILDEIAAALRANMNEEYGRIYGSYGERRVWCLNA